MIELLLKYNQQKFVLVLTNRGKCLCTQHGRILSFSKGFDRTKLHKKVPRYIYFFSKESTRDF